MRFYTLNYAFAQPYKVLIDGNFLMQCVKIKQDAKEMLSTVLGGVVHIDIRCCLPRNALTLHC
jgi:rRNA-processing protein FCF1